MSCTNSCKRRRLEHQTITDVDENPKSISNSDEMEWQSGDENKEKSPRQNSTIRVSVLNNNSISCQAEGEEGEERKNALLGLSSELLQWIFSFSTHEQLALQLPLVCTKWYQVVSYHSDDSWKSRLTALLQITEETSFNNNRTVFQHQQLSPSTMTAAWKNFYDFFSEKESFLTTTAALRTRRNKSQSSKTRRDFIFAYRRHVLCQGFFEEMNLKMPPIDVAHAKTSLQEFQRTNNLRLPTTFFTLLCRHKIHRHIPHLWYANLDFRRLQYIALSSNRILLHWLSDCQSCWTGFVLFDKEYPVSDPPAYSEVDRGDDSFGFHEYLRRYHDDEENSHPDDTANNGTAMDRMQKDAKTVESQLLLENVRLSNFLEQHAMEAKHWDMEDANSSIEAPEGLCRREEDDEYEESSDKEETHDRPRRSKRLNSTKNEMTLSDTDVEYEDFGVVQQSHNIRTKNETNPRLRSNSTSSSEELEWQDHD